MCSKVIGTITLTLFAFVFSCKSTWAKVVINEVDPSEEWVELYSDQKSETLSGCKLALDDSAGAQVINFEESDVANPYFVVHKGDRSWSNNWLNNSGDDVILECAAGSDKLSFGKEVGKASIGRSPDGSNNIVVLSAASPGSANVGVVSDISPSPFVVTTPIATTKTNPINTPAPETPAAALAVKKETLVSASAPTPSPEVLAVNTTSAPIGGYLLMIVGVPLIAASGYLLYRDWRQIMYNKEVDGEGLAK